METFARNQLVWLDPLAWAQIETCNWDSQAQEILAHWRSHRLPLVVCRQRSETLIDQVCVGLPAPKQWSRRRLALTVSKDHITERSCLPTLVEVASAHQWASVALELSKALASLGVTVYVYGSYGWQWITGMAYVHEASDLDLSLAVTSFEVAGEVVQKIATTSLHCRIDGEIVFPKGHALAWRELHQLMQGQTSQVLVKDRHTVRLAAMAELRQLGEVLCL